MQAPGAWKTRSAMPLLDVSDMLLPAEQESAEKWKKAHAEKCRAARFMVVSSTSGYGFRLRVLCQACNQTGDVTDPSRDPIPKK